AILSNVIVALEGGSDAAQRAAAATVTLTGGDAEARDRLKRIKEVGFDDVLCMTPLDALDDLERLRDAAAGPGDIDGREAAPYLGGMALLPIITAPDPRLKVKARPVAAVD